MSEKKTFSVREAAGILMKKGILDEKTTFPEQSVKRLIKQGVLKGISPPTNYPKQGWKIFENSLESYISLGKMKHHELISLTLQLKREIAILKGEIEGDHEQIELIDDSTEETPEV